MDECVANVVNSDEIKDMLELEEKLQYYRAFYHPGFIIPENYSEAVAKVGKCKDEIKLLSLCVSNSNEGIQTKSTLNFATE